MTHIDLISDNSLLVVAIYEQAIAAGFDADWGRCGTKWIVTVWGVDRDIFSAILDAAAKAVPVAA